MNKEYNMNKRVIGSNCKKFKGKVVLTFYFLLFTFFCSAQDSIRISGQLVNNTKFAKVVVQKFGVGVFDIVAIAVDKETGKFSITAPKDVEAGIYRFRYSQTGYGDYVDVIINGKEKQIDFSVDVYAEPDNRMPVFTQSDENKAWYLFKKEQGEALNAIRIKEEFLSRFPNKKDKSYQSILKEYEKAKKNYQKLYQDFVNKTPFYWAQAQALFNQVYFTQLTDHPRLQVFEAHENFWIGKPTTDTMLLNTPLYTDAILSYIQYYMNPEMEFGEEEQKAGYKKCIDRIVEVFSGTESTQEFAIKYLQLGFKEMGIEEILQYIDEKYAATAQCTEEDEELKKRLAGYEAMKPGMQAPNIAFIEELNEKIKDLYSVKSEQTIVVFWASWCPHCMEELPKINEWAKINPAIKVIAISLDEDKTAYQTAITNFTNLLHYCDLKKWNSKAVADYYVYGTPTFFVLDKHKKIVGKYADFDSVKKL
jgi:thiol-disulfide isomerase/thioredoxin